MTTAVATTAATTAAIDNRQNMTIVLEDIGNDVYQWRWRIQCSDSIVTYGDILFYDEGECRREAERALAQQERVLEVLISGRGEGPNFWSELYCTPGGFDQAPDEDEPVLEIFVSRSNLGPILVWTPANVWVVQP